MDSGAAAALSDRKSLFPAGVTQAGGSFSAQDSVRVVGPDGRELARGIVNYAAEELRRLMGKSSQDFSGLLGYNGVDEVMHRDNVCLTAASMGREDSEERLHG